MTASIVSFDFQRCCGTLAYLRVFKAPTLLAIPSLVSSNQVDFQHIYTNGFIVHSIVVEILRAIQATVLAWRRGLHRRAWPGSGAVLETIIAIAWVLRIHGRSDPQTN